MNRAALRVRKGRLRYGRLRGMCVLNELGHQPISKDTVYFDFLVRFPACRGMTEDDLYLSLSRGKLSENLSDDWPEGPLASVLREIEDVDHLTDEAATNAGLEIEDQEIEDERIGEELSEIDESDWVSDSGYRAQQP